MINRAEVTIGAKIWALWIFVPIGFALLAICLEANWDVVISAQWVDSSGHAFPWRGVWLFKNVIHRFGYLPAVLMFLMAFVIARSWWTPFVVRPVEPELLRRWSNHVLLSVLTCGALVMILKRFSNTACAWDLAQFGGNSPHLGWFEKLPLGIHPGHCWPAAFSSVGFVFLALYFVAFDMQKHGKRFGVFSANQILLGVLIYANALGWMQVMRGAHGLSHQIWTGVICWYVCLALYALMFLRKPIRVSP